MNFKTLITIRGWRRPDYLKQVLDALLQQKDIEQYPIFISIDYHQETHKEQIELSEQYTQNNIEWVLNDHNFGCAGNMRFCFNYSYSEGYDYFLHLEDDTVPGKDWLQWMLWAYEYCLGKEDKIFCITPFSRRDEHISWNSNGIIRLSLEDQGLFKDCDPTKSFLKNWFQVQGGYGMTREQQKYIIDLGGIFGAHGNTDIELPPEQWRKQIKEYDWASFAWPMQRFHRRGKLCLTPSVSRSNNIGSDNRGVFNPGPDWHRDHVFDPNWINSDQFKDTDFTNIKYKTPEESNA